MHANDANMDKILYKDLSFQICGLLFKVHNELGRFRNEKQYADRLEQLLKDNKINYLREFNLPQSFIGEHKNRNRIDFIIDDKIIIECKTKTLLTKEDYSQTLRYLTTLNKRLGILVNFRQTFLKPKRIVNPNIH
jgi:GxxExxY protein